MINAINHFRSSQGAILSGTDPVAVAGLLNALGAPPRLRMHVAGESLLNDGSTVLLFQIFSALYYYEFGIPYFGDDIGWGEGIKIFLRLALGGAAIGLAFGIGTVLLIYLLNRRLSAEENVIQVVSTICSAYLAYFTTEILCNSSGIISTLVCGLTVKVLGQTMINDYDLTLHFWQVTGQLLNTLLFALGESVFFIILSTQQNCSTFILTVHYCSLSMAPRWAVVGQYRVRKSVFTNRRHVFIRC